MKKKISLVLPLLLSVVLISCSSVPQPSEAQIKSDLIGHQLVSSGLEIFPLWTFKTLSEFEQFDIHSKQIQGDILEYKVRMKLRYLGTNEYYITDVIITYKRTNTRWELISIIATSWERGRD